MALIDGRMKVVPLPHRQRHSVTINQVSGRVLRIARQRQSLQRKHHHEALDQFDIDTVLRAGVVQWTFPEPISAEAIAMVDKRTKVLLAAEIIALSSRA